MLMIDPGYKISRALTGVYAETGRRLMDSLILPVGLRDYANDLETSVDSLIRSVHGIVDQIYIGRWVSNLLY